MLGSSMMARFRDRASICGRMGESMMANGKIIKRLEEAYLSGQMAKNTLENSKTM